MTDFCMVDKDDVCCRLVKAMAAAVAAALALDVVETIFGLIDGTAEEIDDVFIAEKGSRSTRLPLTIAT